MGIVPLNQFPRGVLEEIFTYLNLDGLICCFCTCKDFQKTIKTSPKLAKKLEEYAQQFFLMNIITHRSAPPFKKILYTWRNAPSDLVSSPHSLDEENVIRKTFETICSSNDQNQILSSFKLFASQQETVQRQKAIQKIAKSGGGLLLWYIAVLEQDDRLAAALIQLQCLPQKMVNPFTQDDLSFGFQLVYYLTTHLPSEELEMFLEHEMKFNFEKLQAFTQRFSELRSPDAMISPSNYEATEANENAFQFLQNYLGENILDYDIQWLIETEFPRHFFSPEYRFLRYGLKKKRFMEAFWTSQEMRSLINGGRKIEDADLSKALTIGPNVGISGVVRVFIAVGALDPGGVDTIIQKLYNDNIHAKNEGYDHLTIDGATLQVLIETSGIERTKVNTYLDKIHKIIKKNNEKSSHGLQEILNVLSNPKPFLEQHELSKKFQTPLPSKDLIKLLNKDRPISLKAHHLSYALKSHYPKEIIELMFKHQMPVEDIHLAVALQWGCSPEIIQLLMEKIPPQIYHLNCALQYKNPTLVIKLFFDYWKEKKIHLEKSQFINVLDNAKGWGYGPAVLSFFEVASQD